MRGHVRYTPGWSRGDAGRAGEGRGGREGGGPPRAWDCHAASHLECRAWDSRAWRRGRGAPPQSPSTEDLMLNECVRAGYVL